MHKMLGKKVRDKITGFSGVVTTVADHLTGCERAWVEGPCDDKGKSEQCWIDTSRLDVMPDGHVTLEPVAVAMTPSPSNCTDPNYR